MKKRNPWQFGEALEAGFCGLCFRKSFFQTAFSENPQESTNQCNSESLWLLLLNHPPAHAHIQYIYDLNCTGQYPCVSFVLRAVWISLQWRITEEILQVIIFSKATIQQKQFRKIYMFVKAFYSWRVLILSHTKNPILQYSLFVYHNYCPYYEGCQ